MVDLCCTRPTTILLVASVGTVTFHFTVSNILTGFLFRYKITDHKACSKYPTFNFNKPQFLLKKNK